MGEINRDGEYPHMTLGEASISSGWQLCPKCEGKGYTFPEISCCSVTCDVCNGKKIISIDTGLPPA